MVWTLTTRGKTEKAFASLRMDYFVDNLVMASETGALGAGASDPVVRGNKAPVLEIEGKTELTTKVGKPVTLVSKVTDDGVPAPHPRQSVAFFFVTSEGKPPGPNSNPNWQPPLHVTVDSATGLWASCYPYRGAGEVTFEPVQIKVWEDSRTGANSPWSPTWMSPPAPPDGKWVTQATFAEPGDYVLRCMASDGALVTDREIKIAVAP
jgi:hypothetical protein